MSKFKRLKTIKDYIWFTKLFNRAIGYSNVPWEYYASGKMYAATDEKCRMIGGFVLVPGYFNLRSILQMSPERVKSFYEERPDIANNLADLTGYFILRPNLAFKLTLWLTIICLFYHKKYFVYTYPISDTALEQYYGEGKPIRIHTGVPERLLGHSEHMESEHVEILTKLGIVKIFYYRTKRLLKLKTINNKRKT
jgi:hypothetical protein